MILLSCDGRLLLHVLSCHEYPYVSIYSIAKLCIAFMQFQFFLIMVMRAYMSALLVFSWHPLDVAPPSPLFLCHFAPDDSKNVKMALICRHDVMTPSHKELATFCS